MKLPHFNVGGIPVLLSLAVTFAPSVASAVAQPTAEELVARARRRPTMLFTEDMLTDIRERLHSDPEAYAWKVQLIRDADWIVKHPIQVPERGGQWPLWMNCSVCGERLRSDSPTRHVCVKCGKEHSGWPYDDVYLTFRHDKCSVGVRNLAIAWRITGNRLYAEAARAILLGYAAAYPHYEWHGRTGPCGGPNKGGARVAAQILDEAVWLVPIVEGYDALADAFAPQDRLTIERDLIRASAETIRTECLTWSNHEVWHLVAYGRAGLALGDVKLVNEALYGRYGVENQLSHGILSDGLWHEGAMHYHFYTMDALTPFFRALSHLGYRVPEAYRGMFDVPFGQLAPDGQLPPVNDSWPLYFRPGDQALHYEMAWAWWQDPRFGRWISQAPRQSMEYALWGKPVPEEIRTNAWSVCESRLYGQSGLAVLRAATPGVKCAKGMPDNCLMMDFGPHGGWHGHPDKLNVFFWLHGLNVSEDVGCIGYGNARHWGWYKSALAHNVIRVDGRNPGPSTAECFAFDVTNGIPAVAASLSGDRKRRGSSDGPAYPGVDFVRATALDGDIVLDFVTAQSEAEHDYEWCFHARGEFSTAADFLPMTNLPPRFAIGTYDGTDIPGTDSWAWVENPRQAPCDGCWKGVWRRPEIVLSAWQRASSPGLLCTGSGSAQPTSERVQLAANRIRAKSVAFASVFSADPRTIVEELSLVGGSDGLRGFTFFANGIRRTLLVDPARRTLRVEKE